MKLRIVYQTLEDRGNPDHVEIHGPFKCVDKYAWLGKGYYFWENYIDNAHWWGSKGNYAEDKYMICKGLYHFDPEKCYDLTVGSPEHLDDLEKASKIFRELFPHITKITPARIINFLKNEGRFPYEGIRASGVDTISVSDHFFKNFRMKFNPKLKAYLNLRAQIQICFLEKTSLNFKNYTVIYPEEYCKYSVF